MAFFKRLIKNFPEDWLTRGLLVFLLVLAVTGAFFTAGLARNLAASTTAISLPGDPVLPSQDDDWEDPDGLGQNGGRPGQLTANLPDPDPWDGKSRINILVLGLDLRDGETLEDDAPLSDAMILLTMDPLNDTAAGIAIPRDMWVPIPGFGHHKINTAFRLGELYNIPGGGPALASQTVEEFLGVPIHFFVQLDFQAFVDFIDHIGGLKMTFDEPITLDRRGRWNKVTLEPGTYALPGEYILAYARDRSTEGHDFDRSGRQLEVIMLIRQRILEFDQLPNLVMNAPAIYQDLSAGIRTNLGLNQIVQLAWRAREIPRENIDMVVIGPNHVSMGKSPDGLDILRPIPDQIRLLRDETLYAGGALGPMAEGDMADILAEEAPSITVLNGSYQAGLAEATADWLRGMGFDVVSTGNAQAAAVSEVTVRGSASYGLRWLDSQFGLRAGQIRHDFDPQAEIDLVLVLGDDWARDNPLP